MSENVIIAIITLLSSGAMATVAVKVLERQKTHAETAKLLADGDHTDAQATDVLVQASERAVALLRGELERAVSEIRSVREEVDQLRRAGIVKDMRIAELEIEVSELREHVRRLESET